MFPEKFQKILKLIKTTNDRVIVFDASFPDDPFVIMDLDRYLSSGDKTPVKPSENVVKENLTEEDLTDKINREISTWKNRENSAYLGEENKAKKAWGIPSEVKEKAQGVQE